MIPEVSSSSFHDQGWELQRSWNVDKKTRVGERFKLAGLALLLAVATFVVYARACQFGFALLDDPPFITGNPHVQAGLTLNSIVWSFTNARDGAWDPLTWLSLMADSDLYGEHAGGFHFTNIVFHTLNTLLLFAFLVRATGLKVPSAIVSGLFALHPLHVESVVWISERKDVLSTFFGLLALFAYAAYAKRPNWKSYLAAFAFFVLSLLSKQTLVTLPFVLLLVDYWPLDRFNSAQTAVLATGASAAVSAPSWRKRAGRLVLEKLPFFFVSLAFCAIAVISQIQKHAVQEFGALPLKIRVGNAFVAYIAYLEKTFFPHDLAIYYPHPGLQLSWRSVFLAALVIAATSGVALACARRLPYLLVGWFWYLGTLVPMIGIVQIGAQQMADRYTYFPLIGIFFGSVWTVRSLLLPFVPAGSLRSRVCAAAVLVGFLILGGLASWQISYWQDDVTLFSHDVATTAPCAFTRNKLGVALAAAGKPREGIEQFERALSIDPQAVDAQYNIGVALTQLGELDQAAAHFRATLALSDEYAGAHMNLALIESQKGRLDEAKAHLRRAIQITPGYAEAYLNLGMICLNSGDTAGAISNSRRAIELDPRLIDAYRILARTLVAQGHPDEAIRWLKHALTIAPQNEAARIDLARIAPAGGPKPPSFQ
jgi:protein O-mannosyl-transferase